MLSRAAPCTACFAAKWPNPRQRGFTIAEVLAAVLVVAVGLIGIASLYGDAQQTQPETKPQVTAEHLAQNMASRIVANKAGRTGYASVVGVLCVTTGRDSRPHYAAAQEAACWQDEVEQHLPSGSGSITRDTSTNPPTYIIAVSWSAVGTGAASYVLRVQPD